MGTPAVFAIIEGGVVRWSYVHYDGYVSDTGRKLVEHYNSTEQVNALIDLGNLSVLAKSIECPVGHSFETPVPGYTVAYHRDRGEVNRRKYQEGSFFDFLRCNPDIIRYMFVGDTWFSVRKMSPKDSTGLSFEDRHQLIPVGEILSGLVE